MQQPTQFRGSIQTGALSASRPEPPSLVAQFLESYFDGSRTVVNVMCDGQQKAFEIAGQCVGVQLLCCERWYRFFTEAATASMSSGLKRVVEIRPADTMTRISVAD